MPTVNAEVFRQYDVRGLVERDLTDEFVTLLGKGYAAYIAKRGVKKIALGRDCRLSGPRLSAAFSGGVRSAGIDVIDLGVVPTPVVYWSAVKLDVGAGVQITGSHNPPEYNGFKLGLGNGTLHGEEIQEIRRIIERDDFVRAKKNGRMSTRTVLDDYIADLAGRLDFDGHGLSVVIDAGNGTGGVVAAPLYRQKGCTVHELYCDMDGSFPNHHPDPTVEKNLVDLQKKVHELHADIGLSFDGDADRLGVVTPEGDIVWGDRIMILLGRAVLADVPGATIIGEVKCSQTLYDDIEKHGGRAIMFKTGHSLIKAKMKEEKAMLAGEMSGHIFFAHRFYGFDDALYAGGRVLEIMARTKKTLRELLADVPRTCTTPELRVDCPEELKFKLVERCVQHFKQAGLKVIDVDGARVIWPDGAWGLVRASNTQPLLVMRFEAATEQRLNEVRRLFEADVEKLRAQLV
jgi:phosphomannomutase / phosphoglucomutase